MKSGPPSLYATPLSRWYDSVRGGFWEVAEATIADEEGPGERLKLIWAWEQLLWAYWEPRAPRRRVKSLERRFLQVYESLPEKSREQLVPVVIEALDHYDPPCYAPAVLHIPFGPDLVVPLDRPVGIKPLDAMRLRMRKEYRLFKHLSSPECPCEIAPPGGLLDVLARFHEYVGYRTSRAPALGKPPEVIQLFEADVDVYDLVAIEDAILALCRRTPYVYRREITVKAARLYQRFPSALLEHLSAGTDF